MRQLIVNADDFGVAHGVNRAVAELHQNGLLSSATLMAREVATEAAVQIAQERAALGVGCHIVLLNGTPMLPATRIPALHKGTSGRFYSSLTEFLPRQFTGLIPADQIEAEASAQLEYLQSHGIPLTHIDAHKHVHSFPQILRPILRAARRAGIRAVRNPFEPTWSLRATQSAPAARRAIVQVHGALLQRRFLRIVAEEGFVTTDGALGVAATGSLLAEDVQRLIDTMPDGIWELVTHPGYPDADLKATGTVLLEQRIGDMQALEPLRSSPLLPLQSFAALTRH